MNLQKMSPSEFQVGTFQMEGGTEPFFSRLFFGGWGNFPYISRIHIAYIGEDSFYFRYLKCFGEFGKTPFG